MTEKIFHDAPEGGLAYVVREGESSYPLHILMLHGWSGDERVMWVLESVLPDEAPVASLRGLYPLAGDGYQWTNQRASIQTSLEDLVPASAAVQVTLAALTDRHSFKPQRVVPMGFSQGAALSFTLAESLEEKPRAVIALAGYYPNGQVDRILDIPVFWGHGTRDELVPINRARQDVEMLQVKGANVHYCETDVGHKLGIECTRGLKLWLNGLISSQ
ncbi:MAG: dienelactone hydrolase family protein [Anaerolineales bacterium]